MDPYYTIGHSTRSIETLVELLQSAEVHLVVDVRTVPRSRGNPQYNLDALAPALAGSTSPTSRSPRSAACAGGALVYPAEPES
jgi:uncharacterized protein (DUF488 family)